jgi:hypothetical protein
VFTDALVRYHRGVLEEMIAGDGKVLNRYVDMRALRELYGRYVTLRSGDDALSVWKAVTLGLWLRYADPVPGA